MHTSSNYSAPNVKTGRTGRQYHSRYQFIKRKVNDNTIDIHKMQHDSATAGINFMKYLDLKFDKFKFSLPFTLTGCNVLTTFPLFTSLTKGEYRMVDLYILCWWWYSERSHISFLVAGEE
jgi:hypothetical protein